MTVFKEGPFIDYSTASMLNVIDGQSSRISKLKSTPDMTADIDRQKLTELCARATPGPWVSEGRATGKSPDACCGVIASNDDLAISNPSRGITAWACRLVGMTNAECEANASFIAAARTTLPTLLDLTDAQAAKIAELEAKKLQANHELNKADLRIRALESERDQLRKRVKRQFVAGMRRAAEIANDTYETYKACSDWDYGAQNACVALERAILSAASALEQKEQG